MEKTIEQVGVGGLILTEDGNTVRVTKIEPNPILQVVHGRSVIVHYERIDDPSLTGEAMCGTLTTVKVPESVYGKLAILREMLRDQVRRGAMQGALDL